MFNISDSGEKLTSNLLSCSSGTNFVLATLNHLVALNSRTNTPKSVVLEFGQELKKKKKCAVAA